MEEEPRKPGRPRKLHKDEPGFYKKIGGKGGEHTRDRNGPDFYAKIAKLSHMARRRNRRRAAMAKAKESAAA